MDWKKGHAFRQLTMKLRFLQRIFWCAEVFLCQDLASESDENEDGSLESLFHRVEVAISETILELSSVCQEINQGLDLECSGFNVVISSLQEPMETLKLLIKKALEKYKYSSQSKHCTMEELLEFIQSFLEDIKGAIGELFSEKKLY